MKRFNQRRAARLEDPRAARRAPVTRMVELASHVYVDTGCQYLLAPILVQSLSNLHVHHMRMHAIKAKQEGDLRLLLDAKLNVGLARKHLPLDVELIRVAPNKLDQGNIAAAHKTTQDTVGRWLGVDDRHDALVRYHYRQQDRGPKTYGLAIWIWPRQKWVEEQGSLTRTMG